MLRCLEMQLFIHDMVFECICYFTDIGIALVAITVTVTPLTALIVLCTAKGQGFREVSFSHGYHSFNKYGDNTRYLH